MKSIRGPRLFLGLAVIFAVLVGAVWSVLQTKPPALEYGVVAGQRGWVGDFRSERFSMLWVTNHSAKDVQLNGQVVQWRKGERIVNDGANVWNGVDSVISLSNSAAAALPFEVPVRAEEFRVRLNYSWASSWIWPDGLASRALRFLPNSLRRRLPKDDGRYHRQFETPWLTNQSMEVSASATGQVGGREFAAKRMDAAGPREMSTNCCYTVTGRAVYSSFGRRPTFSYDFTLTVSNDCWGMEFIIKNQASNDRVMQNYDGVNLVKIRYFDRSSFSKVWNDGTMVVEQRRVPLWDPPVAHAVFVGYAGQFYLPGGTNGLLCPLWQSDRQISQTAFVEGEWNLLAPGRPEVLKCFHDASRWNYFIPRNRVLGASRDEKPLIALYHSFGKTNFMGEVFPAAFAFVGFAPDREDGVDKAAPVYEIEVTNVVLKASAVNRLFDQRFKGAAIVEDFRDGLRYPIVYNITNSTPPAFP